LKNIVISSDADGQDTLSPQFSTSKHATKSPSVFDKESITQVLNNSHESISKQKKKQVTARGEGETINRTIDPKLDS